MQNHPKKYTFQSTPEARVPYFSLLHLPALDIIPQLLMLCDEKAALRIAAPHEDADLVGIAHAAVVLGHGSEVLEQEARGGLHALVLDLPEADLVDDCRGQDGGLLAQLRVGVGGQVRDDLVRGDAVLDGAADGVAGDAAGDHVRVARGELGEEGQDGDLQGRRRVRVQPVVGLDDDEARGAAGGGGRRRGGEARGDGAQGRGGGGQGRGEAGGEEFRGRGGRDVD